MSTKGEIAASICEVLPSDEKEAYKYFMSIMTNDAEKNKDKTVAQIEKELPIEDQPKFHLGSIVFQVFVNFLGR